MGEKGQVCIASVYEGGLAIRVVPRKPGGYAECRFTERLEPGAWLVTAKIRGCRRAELAVRRQKDGRNREDGVFAHCAVPRGEWRKFVKIGRVLPGTDGLNVVPRGVGVDASGMLVGDIRIVRLTAND